MSGHSEITASLRTSELLSSLRQIQKYDRVIRAVVRRRQVWSAVVVEIADCDIDRERTVCGQHVLTDAVKAAGTIADRDHHTLGKVSCRRQFTIAIEIGRRDPVHVTD